MDSSPAARRRLAAATQHITAAAAPHPSTTAPPTPPPRLLSDAQVREFLAKGVLMLPVDELPPSFHRELHARAQAMHEAGLALGDNIYPGVAGLRDVMDGPTVRGALQSVLGGGYAWHSHRHMHNSSTQGEQTFHKDGQRGPVTGFRPRAVMILYYPAGCVLDMGPTAVVPQSHLLCSDGVGLTDVDGEAAQAGHSWNHLGALDPNDPTQLAPFLAEQKLTTPLRQGSVALVHYDTIHRGTARALDQLTELAPFRPMFKFNFLRTSDPSGSPPSWDHDAEFCATLPPFANMVGAELAPCCQSLFEFMLGDGETATSPPPTLSTAAYASLAATLRSPSGEAGAEAQRVHAAFTLARSCRHSDGGDEQALRILMTALTEPSHEAGMRAAMHALACGAGPRSCTALVAEGLSHPSFLVAGRAAEALGEASAPTVEVVTALQALVERAVEAAAALGERDIDWSRSNFLQETGQVPMLPVEEREAAQMWLTVRYCSAALATLSQRAAAAETSGNDPKCLAVASAMLPLLRSPFCWVRHFAALGFVSLAPTATLRLHSHQYVAALVEASTDTSAVPDKNAAAPATLALARLRGGGDAGPVGAAAARIVDDLVKSRFAGR